MTESSTKRELLRLLELDYERTNKFVEGVAATSITIRGWAITITLALVGVGFDRDLWQVSVLALVVALLFAVLDAYQSGLYSQGLAHSASIEATLAKYYASLARGNVDERAVEDFEVALESQSFGLSANLVRFQFVNLFKSKPRFGAGVLYLTLVLTACVAAVAIALL